MSLLEMITELHLRLQGVAISTASDLPSRGGRLNSRLDTTTQ